MDKSCSPKKNQKYASKSPSSNNNKTKQIQDNINKLNIIPSKTNISKQTSIRSLSEKLNKLNESSNNIKELANRSPN